MEDSVENALPGMSRLTLFTPRTPKIRGRQLRFSLASTTANEENEITDGLEELLLQTWNIYGVSTLFGFQQNNELQLKLYAKRLREEIASTLSQEDVSYDAKFSVMENVTPRPSPMDPPPVKVEVFCKNTGNKETPEKSIYKGVFMSWRTQQTQMNSDSSLRLPLLLCRGTRSCINAVHHTMSLMFDCMITALPATEDDLMWLIPIIITPSNKDELPKAPDEAKMEYLIPELPPTDTISIKFKLLHLVKMLQVITRDTENDSPETHLEVHHVKRFHEILHKQILEASGLQLGLCTLHRIHIPALTIMDNKIKVTNIETMNRVLLFLNEKALDTLHAVHFDF